MKNQLLTSALGLVLLWAPLSSAQEKAKPWWNPFAGDTTSSKTASQSDVRTSSQFGGASAEGGFFKLPELKLPSWSSKSKSSTKKKSPSVISRMGSTSKRWWNNTVDFVNPFDSPASKPTMSQGYQPQNMQSESKSSGGMFGWLWREEPPEEPVTVNDFLRQPRPRF